MSPVVEAMKMQMPIAARHRGVIAEDSPPWE